MKSPLSIFTKSLFIVVSMGGYFSAVDYLKLIEQYDNLHDEDDMDDILNTHESNDQQRSSLTVCLTKFLNEWNKNIQYTQNESNSYSYDLKEFQELESACADLTTIISSYIKYIQSLQDKLIKNQMMLERLIPLDANIIQYHLLYLSLQTDLNIQLEWENSVLHQVYDDLQNGMIYSHYNHNEKGMHSTKSILPTEYTNIQQLIRGIKSCEMLDIDLWSKSTNIITQICASCNSSKNVQDLKIPNNYTTNSLRHIFCTESKQNYTIRSRKLIYEMHEEILKCTTIEEIVKIFLRNDDSPQLYSSNYYIDSHGRNLPAAVTTTYVAINGPPGSGKTFLCDWIEDTVSQSGESFEVIRPRLPADILGAKVGYMENSLVSLISYSINQAMKGRKIILILDDIEHIIGNNDDAIISKSENMSHLICRNRGLFFSLLDRLKDYDTIREHILVICTATSHRSQNELRSRFDISLLLGIPDYSERRTIIERCLNMKKYQLQGNVETLLHNIANNTVGRSAGEIASCCRKALTSMNFEGNSNDWSFHFIESTLERIQESLRYLVPESIKNGNNESYAEIRVFSYTKLLESYTDQNEHKEIILPLFGDNAREAWRVLQDVIISPLCRRKELEELLYGGSDQCGDSASISKAVNTGLLLVGDPGTGKTQLAYHCAAVASSLNPSIRLLDVSCTSLIHKELGASEKSIVNLFDTARAAAPCVLLLDGIENIAAVRGNDNTSEGTQDRVLSTLLMEMDGLGKLYNSSAGIAVIGVTHNLSWIDPALCRPGRLEKCVYLQKPDSKALKDLISKELSNIKVDFLGAGYFDPKNKTELESHLAMKMIGMSASQVKYVFKEVVTQAIFDIISNEEEGDLKQVDNISISLKHFQTALQSTCTFAR